MTTNNPFVASRPVLSYYVLTFAVSWGGFLLVGGAGLFAGTSWQTDPRFLLAVLAMLAGPPVACILMTALVSGRRGLRELLSRLVRWRVGARWYALALLIAPLVQVSVLLALSLLSPRFLPTILTTDSKVSLLAPGIMVGLAGGLAEELGWTGFVVPRLRPRHGVLVTGVVMGVLWGAWHLLQMLWLGLTSPEAVPLALFLAVYVLTSSAALTAFRVLMVWVYGHTGSLLVAVVMHASYIFSTLFVFGPPTTGIPFLIYSCVFTAALWLCVAAVATVNRGQLSGLATSA